MECPKCGTVFAQYGFIFRGDEIFCPKCNHAFIATEKDEKC